MHHKCVQYHDLFHGMITLFTDTMCKINCFADAQKEALLGKCSLKEARITLGIDKIETIRKELADRDLETNLKNYAEKLNETINVS